MKSTFRILVFLNIAAFFFLTASAQSLCLKPGDRVAVCGDSITEQKRYSVFIEDYLLMCQPGGVANVQTMQFGIGGDTSWGFLSRFHQNTAPFNPTVLTTCFGMNDGAYSSFENLAQERKDRYRQSLEGIVANARAVGVREIILGSPGVVDTATFKRIAADVYNDTLFQLGEIARDVARRNGVRFADVHGAMLSAMKKAKAKNGADFIVAGGDGVHPGANGHLVMAYAFLKALGCDGDIATITWDCAEKSAVASEGQQVVSATRDSLELESTRWPFCFFDGAGSPESARRMVGFVPFNEELNRYILVVKNAPAPRVKLSWGNQSREYAAAELAKGVNLAADFLDNPFCDAFGKVHAVVMDQQAYETDAVKVMINSLPAWKKHFPAEEQTVGRLEKMVLEKSESLLNASAAAPKPVRHTLKIEAAK